MTVSGCIVFEHDLRLLLVAALICAIGTWATIALFERAARAASREKTAWNLLTALVGGASVWCTHFIAILGYRPGGAVTLDAALTIVSLLVAIAGVAIGTMVASSARRSFNTVMGGACIGLGIAAMHYTGIFAYGVQGIVTWNRVYLVISVAFSAGLSILSFYILRNTAWVHRRSLAAAVLVVAILSLHFTGMMAFRVEPLQSAGNGLGPGELGALAAAVAAIALLVIGAAFCVNLIDSNTRAEAAEALDNMSTGVLMVAPDGTIRLYNNRLLELFNLGADAIAIDAPIEQFLHAIGRVVGWYEARTRKIIENHFRWMEKGETVKLEHYFDDGKAISISARPLRAGGMILTYDDVTALRESQKKINHMAFHDALTGLANRRSFTEHLARLSPHSDFVLLMIDLDRFKPVNDQFGHAVGDELLVMVADRLRESCRASDLAFRLGGDEMALLLPATSDGGYEVGQRIAASLSRPYTLRGNVIRIGASIGSATSRAGDDASVVQHKADLALYQAKEAGRGGVAIYHEGMIEK